VHDACHRSRTAGRTSADRGGEGEPVSSPPHGLGGKLLEQPAAREPQRVSATCRVKGPLRRALPAPDPASRARLPAGSRTPYTAQNSAIL